TAATEGSLSTTPSPFTRTSVFAVPRSTAISLAGRQVRFLLAGRCAPLRLAARSSVEGGADGVWRAGVGSRIADTVGAPPESGSSSQRRPTRPHLADIPPACGIPPVVCARPRIRGRRGSYRQDVIHLRDCSRFRSRLQPPVAAPR